MILHDLLQQLDLADVEAIVDCLYEWGCILPEDVAETGRLDHLACYAALALWLKELAPAPLDEEEKDLILLGHQEKYAPDAAGGDIPKAHVVVHLYRKEQLKRLAPKALAANVFFGGLHPSDGEVAERLAAFRQAPKEWESMSYLCDFSAQLVACEVSWDNVVRCGLHAFLAGVLYEMSFCGYYSEEYEDVALAALARVLELLPMRPEERERFQKRIESAGCERDGDEDEAEQDGDDEPENDANERGPEEEAAESAQTRRILNACANPDPALEAAENRVDLWNSIQERQVLLRWLGAVPALDKLSKDILTA